MANNPTQLTILQDEIRRRYDTLSKRLKQVARYILDNSNSVAFDTVASIAQQADVPPSTLIRFANAFGFSGFNEMKQMFKQHLMEEPAGNANGNPQYVHDGEQPGAAAAGDADLQR